MHRPLAIFLMGPTASGKTGVAVELVQRLPLEIISVDSALVYRGMDIGTAKPDAETLRLAPHRLIDIRDPSEVYSAAEFREDALYEIASMRLFAGLSLDGAIPDHTTIMNFRHLLERHGLARKVFQWGQ